MKSVSLRALYDVVIVGGGPAGLSAALWLGRCRRRTLLLDAGHPRNAASRALHGFLTRDGTAPGELLRLGRAEIARYPSVRLQSARVRNVQRKERSFDVETEDGLFFRARLLLLATGRVDELPEVPGFQEFYGRGVYHCAYCDGWEHRDQAIAIYGCGGAAGELADLLRTWSDNVFICLGGDTKEKPADSRFPVVTAAIRKLTGDAKGRLARIIFVDGSSRSCRAIFFSSDCIQKSDLPRLLGCSFDAEGAVVCNRHAARGVPRLFVAGNVRNGVHLAITAAAEGAEAALAMNEILLQEDVPPRRTRAPRIRRTTRRGGEPDAA